MAELAPIQRWMQDAILAGRADGAEGLVVGDARLSAEARVGLYARGYRLRLLECLRGDYPALRRFVGDTVFDLFAADYIAACPSTAPSLYAYGAGFAAHLDARRPRQGDRPGSPLGIPAQLAALERARSEVARARGIERERGGIGAAAALIPGSRLRCPGSARLLRLDFDLIPLIEAAERDRTAPLPEPAESLYAVARAHFRVRIVPVEAPLFAFLEALGPAGRDVHQAAAAAACGSGRPVGALLAALALWLPGAAEAGLVAEA